MLVKVGGLSPIAPRIIGKARGDVTVLATCGLSLRVIQRLFDELISLVIPTTILYSALCLAPFSLGQIGTTIASLYLED